MDGLKTKSGIIVAKHEMATIQLAPVEINHDQTVEEMIAGEGFDNSSLITTKNFPNVNGDKLGSEEVNLFLVRPVPTDKACSREKVLALINEAGFVSEDIPALSSLKAREYADELWGANVHSINALGENSRLLDPDGIYVAYLVLNPDFRRFCLKRRYAWRDDDWFIVRRKS